MSFLTGALWLLAGIGIPLFWLWHCGLWLKWGHTELWPGVRGQPLLRRATQPALYWLHVSVATVGSVFVGWLSLAFADAMFFC
jgi:hypothetical protein